MTILKPLNTVVVKITGSRCNLSCDYCFYLNKEMQYDEEKTMSINTLKIFIRQIMQQSGNSFGIVWQGGEPSLAGVEFFKKAIEFMLIEGKSKNKIISNMFQTNGYYLSNEMLELLFENSFLVGLSIDGPKDIHDAYRKTASGNGSWANAMMSWEKLKQKNIATNILTCVTSYSAAEAKRMYDFFKFHGMQWLQFIPISEFDKLGNLKDFSLNPNDWGKFMCTIFDLWFADYIANNNAPNIRFIENAFHLHLGLEAPECTFMQECGNYLVLEHNGDVFSCDFLVSSNTRLGNIQNRNMLDMLNSAQQIDFGKEKLKLHIDCKSCRWKALCYGGCPKYRDKESQKYYFCDSWKMFLNHSESRFIHLVKNFKINNPQFKGATFDASGLFAVAND